MLVAEKALSDCEAAFERLYATDDEQEFRIYWVSSVTLLRAVGHVLQNVDATSDSQLAGAISARYQIWKRLRKEHNIFWEFINPERNNVLKEYEFGFLPGEHELAISDTGKVFTVSWELYCPLSYGAYASYDCRQVLEEAISWWKAEIKVIKSA